MSLFWIPVFVLFGIYSWYYLFLIKILCFTIYYLFCFISFILNMDNSSKSFWCYSLFCICCYYSYARTKSNELFCLSQVLRFALYNWSVWKGSSAQRTPKTCGRYMDFWIWIFRMTISWKIQDFSFWPGFNASKKISGYFARTACYF